MEMLYDSDAFVVVYIDANEQRREEVIEHNEALERIQLLRSVRSSARRVPYLKVPAERQCFEIVDKRSNMEVLLTDTWAEVLRRTINEWHKEVPTEAEVDAVLEQFCVLAQLPLIVH